MIYHTNEAIYIIIFPVGAFLNLAFYCSLACDSYQETFEIIGLKYSSRITKLGSKLSTYL